MNRDERFITVTASAETGEEAFQLASRWIEAYDEQLQAKVQEQFTSLRDEATNRVELLTPELTLAEDKLARFDLENPIGAMESLLSSLEEELTFNETQLRGLLGSSQMNYAGTFMYLEDILPGGSGSVGGGGSPGIGAAQREGSPYDSKSVASIINQSTYLELSRAQTYLEDILPGGSGSVGGGGSPGIGAVQGEGSPGESESVASTLNRSSYLELSQALTRARLTALERELVGGETRLRELTSSTIPIDEARLSSLEDVLESEPRVVTGSTVSNGGGAARSPVKETSSGEMVLNPVYVSLAQDLAGTRVRLATSRREAETLEDQLSNLQAEGEKLHGKLVEGFPILREQVRDLRQRISEAKATRGDLDSEVTSLGTAHEPAMAELDRLLEIEPRLTTIASLSTIREPAVPTSLVAPQRNRNILLAAVLGIMLGGFGALFLGYYRTVPPVARANEE